MISFTQEEMQARVGHYFLLLFVLASMGLSRSALGAATLDCASQLLSRRQALIHHISELNPEILVKGPETETQNLYLSLKREEEHALKKGQISESIQQALREGPLARHFRLTEMNAKELTQFYLNSLFAFSVRTSELWVQEELQSLLPNFEGFKSSEARELVRVAKHILLSFSSPYSLRDQELSLQRAQEHFEGAAWKAFPWSVAMNLVHQWMLLGEHANVSNLEQLWKDSADFSVLTRDQFAKIERAVCDRPIQSGPVCCQSGMACIRCPHNRVWLRDGR